MAIEDRINALEKEVLELKEEIQKRSILTAPVKVVSEDGRLLCTIGRNIEFFDSEGKKSLHIGTDCHGGFLGMFNKDGKIVVKLDIEGVVGARLHLLSSLGDAGVIMQADDSDLEGGWIKVLPNDGEGEGVLSMYKGNAELTLCDKNGKEIEISSDSKISK